MRMTMHNGRIRHSSADHNDRNFDVGKSDSVDNFNTHKNVYWNWLTEYGDEADSNVEITFKSAEQIYYANEFEEMINDINSRAEKQRHYERKTSVEKLLESKKTMPEETIFQLGNAEEQGDINAFCDVFADFINWHNEKFGENIKILNFALHRDETTPHIHMRKVYQYTENGIKKIGQNKALEELGYRITGKRSRRNNVKIEYTADCRNELVKLFRERGIELEKPKKHDIQNIPTNEYILQKQEKQLRDNLDLIAGQMLQLNQLQEEYKRKKAFSDLYAGVAEQLEHSANVAQKGFISPEIEPKRTGLQESMAKAEKALKTQNNTHKNLSQKRKQKSAPDR